MVNWWIGLAKAKEPQPERQKVQASYTPIKIKPASAPKLYGLAQDVEIYTPSGIVDAKAGDLLFVTENNIWVIPPEKVPLGWALKVETDGQV